MSTIECIYMKLIKVLRIFFFEIENKFGKNIIVGTLYRPPCNNINDFVDHLDEALDKICGENKHCYLMGDYNINLVNYDDSLQVNESASASSNNIDSNHNNTQNKDKLLNTFSSYALFPCINKPTRITATSATLIDNIFSNTFNKSNNSGILYHDVSDHLPVFTITAKLLFKTRHKPIEITYRKESVENVRALTEKLVKEEWQDIPLVKQKHCKNLIRNPWITQGIFRSIQTRNKLFKSYVRNPTEQNNCHYKRYRNILTKLIRTSKKLHYSKVLNHAEGNLNSTWKVINELINKNKSQTRTDSLNVNGKDITNPEDVSNEFNSYFTTIGPNLASKINCHNKHFSSYLSEPLNKTIFLNPTNQAEIIKIVKSFKSKKSSGYDGISMKLLKQIIYCIAPPLEYIFNSSLSNGICPNVIKIAKVIPIHKKDDQAYVTNYRPISLLPSISKVLEKIMYKRLNSFLLVNNIIYQSFPIWIQK